MSELPDHFDKLRDVVNTCNRLRELPRITKQIDREVRQLESDYKRLSAQAKRTKFDLGDQLNEIASGITAIRATLTEVAQVKSADAFDDAMAKLEDLHGTFDDLREKIGAVRDVLNISRAMSDARREMRNVERYLGSLTRRGVDTKNLGELLAQGKSLIAELDALAKQQPIDVDALHEKFSTLEDLGSHAEQLLAELRGQKTESAFQPQFGKSPVEGVQLPDSFRQFGKSDQTNTSDQPSQVESLLGF